MLVFILSCVLAASPSDLIDQLGSESYDLREAAQTHLIELSDDAVPLLQSKGLKSTDMEVRNRSDYILQWYYNVQSTNKDVPYPSIWSLSNELRSPTPDVDISLKYYEKAKHLYNSQVDPKCRLTYQKRYPDVEILATRLYIFERMQSGLKRADAVALLDKMNYWHDHLYYVCRYYYSPFYDQPGLAVGEYAVPPRRRCVRSNLMQVIQNRVDCWYNSDIRPLDLNCDLLLRLDENQQYWYDHPWLTLIDGPWFTSLGNE